MRKLLRYKDGNEYIVGGITSIEPNTDYKPEEYDLSRFTDIEFERFKNNKKDKELLKKIKRIYGH